MPRGIRRRPGWPAQKSSGGALRRPAPSTKRSISSLMFACMSCLRSQTSCSVPSSRRLVEVVDEVLGEDAGGGPLAVGAAERDAPVLGSGLLPLDRVDELGAALDADVEVLRWGACSPAARPRCPGGLEVDDLDRLAARQRHALDVVALGCGCPSCHVVVSSASFGTDSAELEGSKRAFRPGIRPCAELRCAARGSERPDDPPGDRVGADRDRSVRALERAAVERRRARRPPVPRLPQRALPVHRRAPADGRPDRARRDLGRRAVHPAPGRVRARPDARARDPAGRPRRPAGGQELARAGSAS